MSGQLTMIVGPMFSAKSAILINMCHELIAQGKRITCIKPIADTRDKNAIISRKGAELPARQMRYGPITPTDIEAHDVFVYDEIHMFHQGAVGRIKSLMYARGKDVICAGLELDWRTRPFAVVSQLLVEATAVVRTVATCDICGAPAHFTQRTIESEELILAGDSESYAAACRACYVTPPCLTFVNEKHVSIGGQK